MPRAAYGAFAANPSRRVVGLRWFTGLGWRAEFPKGSPFMCVHDHETEATARKCRGVRIGDLRGRNA